MDEPRESERPRAPWRRASLILLVTVSFSLAGRTDERGRRQRPTRPLPAFGLTICHLEAQPATLPGLPREAICAGHRVGDVPPRSPSPSESGRPDLSRRSPGRSARLQGDEGECVCGVGSENAISSLITRRASGRRVLQDVRSDPQSRLPHARPERGVTVLTLGAPSPSKRRLLEPGVALRDVMVSGLAALGL